MVVKTYVTLASLLAISVLCAPGPGGNCRFDVVLENEAISPGSAFWVAGRFRIDPEWHIYWINPGESGLPTGLDWKLPSGFKVLETHWPVPKLLTSQGSASYGYEGEVAVLSKIQAPAKLKTGSKVRVLANADWMACKEMCITGEAVGSKEVRVASTPRLDRAVVSLFNGYRKAMAESGTFLSAFVYEGNSRLRLELKIPNYSEAKSMRFFPFKPGVTPASGEQVFAFGKMSTLTMPKAEGFRPTTYLEGVISIEYSQNKRRTFNVKAPYKTP